MVSYKYEPITLKTIILTRKVPTQLFNLTFSY
jgi:hypothetical protein